MSQCKLAAGLLLLAATAYPGTYIVTLGPGPAETASPKREGLARMAAVPPARTERAQILIQQNYVRAALARQTTAEVLDSIDTVGNALIVRIADDQVNTLKSVPGVLGVYPDKPHRKMLNRAVPLVRGTDAWILVGGSDFAGAGIKIGIIDTGVDATHPALQDPQLRVPDAFPKGNKPGDLAYTNSKVIVARDYETLPPGPSSLDPVDKDGHGTAVASTAAAALTFSPLGLISGVAPKAYIGNYKVFGATTASTSSIIKAIDDAVKDGMDVINLSLGSLLAQRSADSPEAQAIAKAAAAGVIVVAAGGNGGPDPNTISDFAVPPDSIAVGATFNDRTFGTPVTLAGVPAYAGMPGAGFSGHAPVSGPIFDVARLDPSGLACNAFPAASLSGRVALILRGTCTFETKLLNAAAAGAIAAVVYTSPDRELGTLDPGSAALAAVMISNADGIDMRARLAQAPDLNVTVEFRGRVARPIDPNGFPSFSSAGPSADLTIKPDLVAVGTYVYMPVLREDPGTLDALFDSSGYAVANGTSFSSPLVAGAAAVVKAARRGLTSRQYRSLIVNSATSFVPTAGPAGVQQAGSGMLNVANAVETPVAVYPTSLSFGTGSLQPRQFSLGNVGIIANSFTISAEPSGGGPAPVVSPNSVQLDPGGSANVNVQFSVSALTAGVYQGVLIVHPGNGPDARIPYWYAVPSGVPAQVTVLDADETDTAGITARNAVTFRVTDAQGIATMNPAPTVTVVAGTARPPVARSADGAFPGCWQLDIVPGRGTNTLRIQAGSASTDVTIIGQ